MVIKKIKQIIAIFEQSKLSEMDLEFEDIKLSLKKPTQEIIEKQAVTITQQPSVVVSDTVVVEEGTWVKSPLVGIFYDSPNPDSSPFVKVGQTVQQGDVLCVIEAMKVMNEIKSTVDGIVGEILVYNQQMVEFNQNLFRIVAHD